MTNKKIKFIIKNEEEQILNNKAYSAPMLSWAKKTPNQCVIKLYEGAVLMHIETLPVTGLVNDLIPVIVREKAREWLHEFADIGAEYPSVVLEFESNNELLKETYGVKDVRLEPSFDGIQVSFRH